MLLFNCGEECKISSAIDIRGGNENERVGSSKFYSTMLDHRTLQVRNTLCIKLSLG